MARQVLPIVGMVVGAYFGAPQLGYAIGSIIGNAVDPQVIKGPKLGEASIQTAAEGVYRPVVHGVAAVMGNIIHRGNRQIVTKEEQAGKGGPVTETEHEYWTFAIRICEGPVAGVLRIWMDEKLVYDNRPDSLIPEDSLRFRKEFRMYLGDEDQLPDPALEAWLGVGNVNAYRGTAYVVFPFFDLTAQGGRVPSFRFEVAANATGTPLQKLPPLPFPPVGNYQGGFIEGTISTSKQVPSSFPFGMTELTWQPKYLIDAGETVENGAFTRGRLRSSGRIIFDTGWFGDRLQEFRLKNLLADEGRGDLYGEVNGRGRATTEITIDEGITIDEIEIIIARPMESPEVSGFSMIIQFPDPALYPEGTVASPLFGVLKKPDGTLVSTSWGPDNVYQDGLPTTLGTIVAWAHQRANQSSLSYDVSELTEDVNGIVFAGEYTCADAIRTLQPVYMFDYTECDVGTGYRGHYIKRGGPVVRTLVATDLVDEPEESTREDALERPRALHMHFESPTIGYAPAKATSRRNSPDVKVVGEQSISVPVSFLDVDEAWRRCAVMHKVVWTEVTGEREFVLSDRDLQLVPTDVVGLFLRGQVQRLRVTEVMLEDGILKVKALADRQSAYTSNVTGVPLPPPSRPPPAIPGQTVWEFLDIPALNDGNDRLLYYIAATGTQPGWQGTQIQRLPPDATDYEFATQFDRGTIMGRLLNDVTPASPHYTDTTNVASVRIFRNAILESLTDQQFLSEGGAFALENDDGTWEVMQYSDAVQDSSGNWTLSPLLRGRLGSPSGMHSEGARFVLLDGVRTVDALTSWIGRFITHRAVSFGNSPEEATPVTDTYMANSQRELPVANILGAVDSGTLSVRVVPRHRFGTEDNPIRSIHWLSYDWSITDGTNIQDGASVSQTFTVDVTGWSTPIEVTVSQRNRYTGLGPSVTESIA